MTAVIYDQKKTVDTAVFSALVGDDIINFIFEYAPRKVATRVAKAIEHRIGAEKLAGIDEEMGVIRLIAGEEELVVAIFEWLKLNDKIFPEHKDFVGKFKNHIVKLAFYPVLRQFRFVIGGMLTDGVTLDGLEGVLNFSVKPVVEGKLIRIALCKEDGEELTRADPFAIDISHGEMGAQDTVPVILKEMMDLIAEQLGLTLKQYILSRAEFRNHMLYATDGGSAALGDDYGDLRALFDETYHDLLWALAVAMGGKPPSKQWGIASQFIGAYRLALIEAGVLRPDNTVIETASNA
ncbi:hypothetical protein [Bosea sp. (in: a-proteobacteria)]|jgi:hypothetical protein|uniref:hypothetical protein n=1 Tax=Bosea sp. (in: a-proteobacteria) TaxID=1871050 RepID=UPI0035683476